MPNNNNNNNNSLEETELIKRPVYAIPPDIYQMLSEINEYFQYNNIALVSRHCMRTGYSFFKEDPEKFRQLVQQLSIES